MPAAAADPTPPTATSAVVTCRTFRGGQRLGVALCLVLPLQALGLATAVGLPPSLSLVAFLAAAALAIAVLCGPCRYTANAAGVRREHRRFVGGRALVGHRRWDEILAWKLDDERGRDGREYEYLELDATRGPRWVVTSRQDPAGFAAFVAVALPHLQGEGTAAEETRRVREHANAAAPAGAPDPRGPMAAAPAMGAPLPRRRGSFYTSWTGRAVTVVLTLAAGLLVVADLTGRLGRTAGFRLEYTILPGVVWLWWRSFGRRTHSG